MKKSKLNVLEKSKKYLNKLLTTPVCFFGGLSYNIPEKVPIKFESILIIVNLVKLSSKLENRTQ